MTWEPWTNGLNQSEISCKMPQCNPDPGWSIWQYLGIDGVTGWVFLIIAITGFIVILIALYLIAVEYGIPEKKPEEKKELEPKSKGKRK